MGSRIALWLLLLGCGHAAGYCPAGAKVCAVTFYWNKKEEKDDSLPSFFAYAKDFFAS